MAFARKSDPVTSYEAAASVHSITETQRAIFTALSNRPMTDEQLVDAYYQMVDFGSAPLASPSGIRSRRAELVQMGYVIDSKERQRLASGRNAIVWKAAF
jgi:hypothetical protein